MNNLFLMTVLFILSISLQAKVYAPFGIYNKKLPSASSLKIVDFEVGIDVQQVCGYNDWSSVQLKLPKELLSKRYWEGIANKLFQQAKQTVLDLSGALPTMLTCNVSPTYCAVLNQAEMMSSFENQLTFDTCQVLDGIANSSLTQSASLKDCIQKSLKNGSADSPGKAREYCLVKSGGLSKKEKNDNLNSILGDYSSFNMAEFIKDLFPEKVKAKTKETTSEFSFKSGINKYSRRKNSIELVTTLFPGVVTTSKATYVKGGTFQPLLEEQETKENNETREEIYIIIKKMKELQEKQYSDEKIISTASTLWTDKNKWDQKKRLHPIYRPSFNGGKPTYLIEPEQLLSLLPLVEEGDVNLEKSEALKKAVSRLSHISTYIKLQDQLGDIYIRSLEQCKTNPKYQDAISQNNCDLILKRTYANMEILNFKRSSEERARTVQKEIQELVRWELSEKSKKITTPDLSLPTRPNATIWSK